MKTIAVNTLITNNQDRAGKMVQQYFNDANM